jgi:hypothetical protein
MNKERERLPDWGLGHVAVDGCFDVLDIGCGGGRTIEKLAAIASSGTVYQAQFPRRATEGGSLVTPDCNH